MNEQLGIVAELQARRERYAKYAYRAPDAGPSEADKLRVKLDELKAKFDRLSKEKARLAEENRELSKQVSALTEKWGGHREVQRRYPVVEAAEVIRVFLQALQRHEYIIPQRPWGTLNGIPYTMEHLMSNRRSLSYAAPRHVAMWLCRRICITSSLTALGKAFGRDHTSIMHGCVRATMILATDKRLSDVADEVMSLFEVKS